MPDRGVAAVAARQQADPADGRLSASDSEEFPARDTAADERERLASAVARGKSVLWPATLIATLGVGVVSSAAGIIKTRNLREPLRLARQVSALTHPGFGGTASSFYFNLFIATLVGWSVLLAIQVRPHALTHVDLGLICEHPTGSHPQRAPYGEEDQKPQGCPSSRPCLRSTCVSYPYFCLADKSRFVRAG